MRYSILALLIVFVLGVSAAYAADIVTVPTANQMKAGEVDLADYYLFLDFAEPQPQFVRVQTIYVGLTDRLELDAHRYDLDKVTPETMWIAQYKLLSEMTDDIDLVLGARDFADRVGHPAMPQKTSYYVSAAKTLNPPMPGMMPEFPIWRVHFSLGTEDPSLLGETRHDGVFGGLQVLAKPTVGIVALYDEQDLITGITYTPKPGGLTVKAGGFGDHIWVGANYTFNLK